MIAAQIPQRLHFVQQIWQIYGDNGVYKWSRVKNEASTLKYDFTQTHLVLHDGLRWQRLWHFDHLQECFSDLHVDVLELHR